jgi:hypothetical protein
VIRSTSALACVALFIGCSESAELGQGAHPSRDSFAMVRPQSAWPCTPIFGCAVKRQTPRLSRPVKLDIKRSLSMVFGKFPIRRTLNIGV